VNRLETTAAAMPDGRGGGGDRVSVLLVHGAWHGAWCWERVISALAERDIRAVAVDLPGHGGDPGPMGDLHGDADRVRQVLDRVDGPVVLVGHSYGGAVITDAGDHPAVAHLVYLCALAIDGDESCMTAAAAGFEAAAISQEGRPDLSAGLVADVDGTTTVEASAAAACLYNDCDEATVAWATARLGPQPLVTLQQTPRAVAWRSKPSTYVVCTDDLTIPPELQRLLAKRCTTSVEWPTSHSPFLSAPDRVADLLADTATGLRGAGPPGAGPPGAGQPGAGPPGGGASKV
jgi:pimeloyl-ACP methyl ester carboxylesterase